MDDIRGGSRTAATSKMERFVIIVSSFYRSISDVAAALDPLLDILLIPAFLYMLRPYGVISRKMLLSKF